MVFKEREPVILRLRNNESGTDFTLLDTVSLLLGGEVKTNIYSF